MITETVDPQAVTLTAHDTHPDTHSEFEALIARTQRQAYNMAYRLTGNRDDAEDLTQEAYLRAYRSFGSYNRDLPFENWFFRILSNLFVDGLRRKPKQKPLSLSQSMSTSEGENDFVLEVADEESDPERQYLRDVLDERLQRGLAALPREFRIAVLLCDIEQMSYEDIARTMGTSVGTVRSRIHRGRKMLRKHVTGEAAQPRRLALKPLAA